MSAADTIRLFVGTDPAQHLAERALESSVRANMTHASDCGLGGDCSCLDITWMRQGDPGWDWGGTAAGWATPFSLFRWFIPEACGRQGRAIYLDVDMLVIGDLRELWDFPIQEKWCGAHTARPDVIVWECSRCQPTARPLTTDRHAVKRWARDYQSQLRTTLLPKEWDHRDKLNPSGQAETKLLHFTNLRTQPWHPYPDLYQYEEHPDPDAERLWIHYLGTAPSTGTERQFVDMLLAVVESLTASGSAGDVEGIKA